MQYQSQFDGEQLTLRLSGNLTYNAHGDMHKMVQDILSDPKSAQIIDISTLDILDSAGLGLLLSARDLCAREGIETTLRVPSEGPVAKMLSVARFDEIMSRS